MKDGFYIADLKRRDGVKCQSDFTIVNGVFEIEISGCYTDMTLEEFCSYFGYELLNYERKGPPQVAVNPYRERAIHCLRFESRKQMIRALKAFLKQEPTTNTASEERG